MAQIKLFLPCAQILVEIARLGKGGRMERGRIIWLNRNKNLGFISPTGRGENVLAVLTDMAGEKTISLEKGDEVIYEATRGGLGTVAVSLRKATSSRDTSRPNA